MKNTSWDMISRLPGFVKTPGIFSNFPTNLHLFYLPDKGNVTILRNCWIPPYPHWAENNDVFSRRRWNVNDRQLALSDRSKKLILRNARLASENQCLTSNLPRMVFCMPPWAGVEGGLTSGVVSSTRPLGRIARILQTLLLSRDWRPFPQLAPNQGFGTSPMPCCQAANFSSLLFWPFSPELIVLSFVLTNPAWRFFEGGDIGISLQE